MAKKKTSKKKGHSQVENDLADIAQEWGDTDASEGFGEIPEGKYQCRITDAKVERAQNSGRLQVCFDLQIASGPHANRKMWKRDGIDNEQSIGYFKGGLAKLGVEAPDDPTDLPHVLSELIGTFCQVTVKIKGDYHNQYFDKAIDDDEVDTSDLDDMDDDTDTDSGDDEMEWSKGDRCAVEIEGEWYYGEISKIKGDNATIKFDDGDTDTYPLSDLEPEEDEGEEEIDDEAEDEEYEEEYEDEDEVDEDDESEEAEDDDEDEDGEDEEYEEEDDEEEGDEDEEGEDEEVEGVTFEFTKFTKAQAGKIGTIAKNHEYTPDDYETDLDLAADIAEYLGMNGHYDDAKSFMTDLTQADKAEMEG